MGKGKLYAAHVYCGHLWHEFRVYAGAEMEICLFLSVGPVPGHSPGAVALLQEKEMVLKPGSIFREVFEWNSINALILIALVKTEYDVTSGKSI